MPALGTALGLPFEKRLSGAPPLLNTEGLQYLVGNDGRNAIDQLGNVVPTVEVCDVAKVKFDGVGDFATGVPLNFGEEDFLIEIYVNLGLVNSSSASPLVYGKDTNDDGFRLTVVGASGSTLRTLYCSINTKDIIKAITIDGDFHLFTGQRIGNTFYFKIDGASVGTVDVTGEVIDVTRYSSFMSAGGIGFIEGTVGYIRCVSPSINFCTYGEENAGNMMFDVSGNGNDIELISTEGTDIGIARMRSTRVDEVLCYTAKNGYSKDGDVFVPAHSEKMRPYPLYDGSGGWITAGGVNYVFLQEYNPGIPPIIPPTPNGRINFNGYYKQEATYISDLSAKYGITSMYGANSSDGVCIELFEDKVRYFPDQALTSYVDIPCTPPKNVFTKFALEHDGNEVSVSFDGVVVNTVTTALTLTQEEMQVLVIGAGLEQGTTIPFKGGLYDYKVSIEKGVLWVDLPLDKELLYPFDRAGSHTDGTLHPSQKTMYRGFLDSRYPLTDAQGNLVKYAGGMLHNGAPFSIKQSDTSDLSLLPSDNIWLETDGTTRKKLTIDDLRALVNMDKDFALQLKRIADDTDPVFPKAIQYKGGTINLMTPTQMNQLKRWTKVIV